VLPASSLAWRETHGTQAACYESRDKGSTFPKTSEVQGSQLGSGCADPTAAAGPEPRHSRGGEPAAGCHALSGAAGAPPSIAAAGARGEGREEELAHLPINDAFALQKEEADGYFCCVESEMKDLKGRLIIKGDESE